MPEKKRWIVSSPYLFIIFLTFFFLILVAYISEPCHGTTMGDTSLDKLMTTYEKHPSMDVLQRDPKKAMLGMAELRLRQGSLQQALRYAKQLVAMDPKNADAHGILGTIYAFTGQREMAQRELDFLKEAQHEGFYSEFIKAMLHAQKGRFKEAEQHISSALKVQPEHPVAVSYRGSLNLAQGRLDMAEESFKTVIASKPDFSPALAGLGKIYLRRKNMKSAAKYYQKAVENDPGNLVYRRQLLEILKATDQKEAANNEIKEMLYYTPGVQQSYLRQGMQLFTEGTYLEAVKLMDKVIGIYKNIPEAFYIKAAAQINLKKRKAALKNIQRYIFKRWGSPQAHHYAGMCYLALALYDKAEKQFRTAVLINPQMGRSFVPLTVIEQIRGNHAGAIDGLSLAKPGGEPSLLIDYLSAHIMLAQGNRTGYMNRMKRAAGLIQGLKQDADFSIPKEKDIERFARERNLMVMFFFNGWYDKTIDISKTLITFSKGDRFAWYYKALSESAQKKYQDVIHSYNKLIAIDPDLLAGHMGVGHIYMRTNDYTKAINAFQKAIAIDHEFGPAYVALGDTFLRTKADRDAIKSYRKAIKINPEFPGTYIRLAMILSENEGKNDETLTLAQKAQELAPNDPYALDVLGWVFVQRGEIEKAFSKLKEASKRLPQDPVVKYHLGVAYYKHKNVKAATTALKEALRISNDFRGADDAKEILQKLSK